MVVKYTKYSEDSKIVCSCETYRTIKTTEIEGQSSGGLNESSAAMTCCHCRIVHHIIDNKNNPPIVPQDLVDTARLAATSPVLYLPSLREDTKKYTVFLDYECQFVTVTEVTETERSVFSCHATQCRSSKSKKRSTGMEEACKHVIKVKKFRGDNEQEIDVDGDLSDTPEPKVGI